MTTQARSAIAEKIQEARNITDSLFTMVDSATLYERPVAERHRLIFYLGHLEAFDWNQICRGALRRQSFRPDFDKLFEFGIDPKPGSAASDSASDWPSVEAVQEYNRRVREHVDAAVDEAPEQILNVALEHRLMHAETLAYLLHRVPHALKQAPRGYQTLTPDADVPVNDLVAVPGGDTNLGQAPGEFGWDNEFGLHSIKVPDFRMSKYKITNGEYLQFVNAGGEPAPFWVADRENNATKWLYKGMFEITPLPLSHPVYVTHQQAEAYAAWRGMSLPTEAQFHRAAYGQADEPVADSQYPWESEDPATRSGNYNFRFWDTVPVTANPGDNSAFGLSQMVGNGWEWTSSVFAPFPGFKAFPFYAGYSQNFFDGEHYVLKGGSCRTGAALLRRSFRNWFRPDYPYAYTTFRLVAR